MNSKCPAGFASRGAENAPAPPLLFVSGLRSKRSPVIVSSASGPLANADPQMCDAGVELPSLSCHVMSGVAGAGDSPKAQPDSNPSKKRSCARLSAARPGSLTALALGLDETSGQTPQATPHTMTETALKKSEDLLAKLMALGLTGDEDCSLDGDNKSAGTLESDRDDAPGIPTPCSSSACLQTPKQRDTVEVPVALLDMLVENWSRCQEDMHSAPSKVSLSKAPSLASSTTLDDLASDQDSLSSISPLQSPVLPSAESMSECSHPMESTPAPPCTMNVVLSPTRQVHSPVVHKRMFDSNGFNRRPTHVQKFNPQLQWSHKPAFRDAIAPTASAEAHMGRRPVACTIQQTVEVTNTVTFHY